MLGNRFARSALARRMRSPLHSIRHQSTKVEYRPIRSVMAANRGRFQGLDAFLPLVY